MNTYICDICGFVYDGEEFTEEPSDYTCPLCEHGKENFHERNFTREVNLATNEYHEVKKNLKK